MARKLSKIAAAASDNQFAQTVRDSAQQIWLAGLGAFAVAQKEGGKVFDSLVKEGETARARAEEKVGEVSGMAGKFAADAAGKAAQTWDKLDNVFETRVAKALNRLNVPTHKELQELNKRIKDLTAALATAERKAARAPAKAKAKKAR